MNAKTKFLAGAGSEHPGRVPLNATLPAPAAGRPRLTEAERAELLEILRDSDTVTNTLEGQAAALQASRERLIAEIDERRSSGNGKVRTLQANLIAAERTTRKLEDQLREASSVEAAIRCDIEQAERQAERDVAERERRLVATADPAIDEARRWFEREGDVTRCFGPPLEILTRQEHEALQEQANKQPPFPDPADPRETRYFLPAQIARAGGNQGIHAKLVARSQAIRAAHARTNSLKLLALTSDELVAEIERLKASIPPIPTGSSQMCPLPYDIELPAPTRREGPPVAIAAGPQVLREAPADMPPDGTCYVDGKIVKRGPSR